MNCVLARFFSRLVLCATGLASLAFTLSASAAEPTAPSQSTTQPPPQWQAERRPKQEKLLADLGADRWHAAGFRGKGVKVLVLDTGFKGWHDQLGKVLPEHIAAHSFRADGNLETRDQHGILCGEVVHTLAPDAELLFTDWDIEKPESFLEAVRWGRQQGARIVTCSIVTPHWSDGEGRGAVHEALASILGKGDKPGGMLCFASAGNTTERHWGGRFHDGGDGFHEWKPGVKDNGITPWGDLQVSVGLYWQPGADYDLFVQDTTTGKEVGTAHTDHNKGDRSSAIIYFKPESGHTYRARVKLVHGSGGVFHLTVMESSLEYTEAKASVCFPADGPDVIAMGAEDGSGHRIWYSACGPNSSRLKPDMMATIPFPTLMRERTFGGTSAAAPQGAALAALLWSRHSDWTADQVRSALKSSARDLAPPGPDQETGYGLIRLPKE
jgi:Subtilase family